VTLPDTEKNRVLELVSNTYDEVLDATKHQDDKIGRLFTGVSFLTAAALALANVGGSAFLRQAYLGWAGPPLAMVFLSVYLLLVVVAVMLLINSLATPLRTPGLSRTPPKPKVDWVNGVKASPLYFGEISKLRLDEWVLKWDGSAAALETERRQALVGETHNLAVRTQFKYGRTTEAIAVFNLALLSLSCTIVLALTAASMPVVAPTTLDPYPAQPLPGFPAWPRFVLGVVVAIFYFVQLQGSVRYTRQTLDEIQGPENAKGARWRYGWVGAATVWAFVVGSGTCRGSAGALVVGVLTLAAVSALFWGTHLQRKEKARLSLERAAREGDDFQPDDPDGPAWGCWTALVLGVVLSAIHGLPNLGIGEGYEFSLGAALAGAAAITALSLLSPTMSQHRNKQRYNRRRPPAKDSDRGDNPAGNASGPEDVANV
jgi:hypothetical protein